MKKILASLFLAVAAALLIAAPAQAKKRVMCIGDSITYGTGIQDRDSDSYPAQLQRMLGEEYEVANFGRSGATLLRHGHKPYIEQEEFSLALDWGKVDYIVIHLGVNDTDSRDWPNYRDEFVGDYLALIDTLLLANPHAKVMIALLSPIGSNHPRFASGKKQWHDEIQDAIRKVAEISGVKLIDFHTPLYPYHSHIPDALHPDEFGAGIMAKTVYEAITGDFGGLSMSMMYTDNMVLQQGVPLDIHGKANAGDKVTVKLGRKKKKATADDNGNWSVEYSSLKASSKPTTLSVSTADKTLEFKNILVGEVWLCSGQSNMAMSVAQAIDLEPGEDNDLRFFDMKGEWSTDMIEWPMDALRAINDLNYYKETGWEVCNEDNSAAFSAVAYAFGRMLREKLGVPVGLICNAVDGSPAESWIGRNYLETMFPAILVGWLQNDFIQEWVRNRAAKNLTLSDGRYIRHPYEPGYLYEAGILPLDKYVMKGVIWYQGESNTHNFSTFEKLFPMLVDSWREGLGNDKLYFDYAQLSSWNLPSWIWFRDCQRRLLECRDGLGMAVTSDLGDPDVMDYPLKKPVGERLALWALHDVYGQGKVVPSGPLYKSHKVSGKKFTVNFSYGNGLAASDSTGVVKGFELAGKDGLYFPADAKIKGESVILTSNSVSKPVSARYGWQAFTRANLVNAAGLPASTFRTE